MARDQQRDELVAQLAVGHGRALVVARLQEQREDVVALGQLGILPAAGDLLEDQPVHVRAQAHEAPPGAQRSEVATQPWQHRRARGRLGQQGEERRAQGVEPLGLAHAEHDAQDDLQRDGLSARAQGERLAQRPAVELGLGDLRHQLGVARHPRTVERGQHQPSLPQVLGSIE